jgi:hypothetical protein
MAGLAVCISCRKLWESTQCRQVLPYMPVHICGECLFLKPDAVIAESDISNKIQAPWQEFQVASLSAYQYSPTFIPFTCNEPHRLLVSEEGMHCIRCNVNLKWAYDWTLDWTWKRLEPPEEGNVPARKKPPTPQRSAEATLKQPEPPVEL